MLIAKQRIIVYPATAMAVTAVAIPLIYWIYMSSQYKLSEKDAVAVCDMEFKRTVILSEISFQIPTTTIINAQVTDFQGIVSEGFYYVYLTYEVEQKADATTNLLIDMEALPDNKMSSEFDNNIAYSKKQVFCKVNKISLQPSKKISRANLEKMVIHNQN